MLFPIFSFGQYYIGEKSQTIIKYNSSVFDLTKWTNIGMMNDTTFVRYYEAKSDNTCRYRLAVYINPTKDSIVYGQTIMYNGTPDSCMYVDVYRLSQMAKKVWRSQLDSGTNLVHAAK